MGYEAFGNIQANVSNVPSDCHPSERLLHTAPFPFSDLWTIIPCRTCVFIWRTARHPYIFQKYSIPNQGVPPNFLSNPGRESHSDTDSPVCSQQSISCGVQTRWYRGFYVNGTVFFPEAPSRYCFPRSLTSPIEACCIAPGRRG